MISALAENHGKTLNKNKKEKYIAMPNYSAFIGAEALELLERHGCDKRENLVHLLIR